MPELQIDQQDFPIRGRFAISRGARTESRVLVATLGNGTATGRGECVPYARYGESLESVAAQIESIRGPLEAGTDRLQLMDLLPAGAARNAVDCALFDLEAKRSGRRAWQIAGVTEPAAATTAFTLSLDSPEAMAATAAAAADRPLLKLKLGGDGDIDRVRAVRQAAPTARLIVDANEAWRPAQLEPFSAALHELGVALIEQPLPAGDDNALEGIARPVPVCADESCHDRASLPALAGRYDAVNIKLDKTGGLTEALALAEAARAQGFAVMVGCMLGTSLAMAPALLLADRADFLDLDGPLLLARDREPGLRYEGSVVHPAPPALWG